jgi:hypothetical protein
VIAEISSVEAYDPTANQWAPRASMPTGRRSFVVGTLNGRAQIMGGERSPSGTGTFAANEEYDPDSNTWRILLPMKTPRHGMAAGTINDVIYVAGGGPNFGTSFTTVNEAFRAGAAADSAPTVSQDPPVSFEPAAAQAEKEPEEPQQRVRRPG